LVAAVYSFVSQLHRTLTQARERSPEQWAAALRSGAFWSPRVVSTLLAGALAIELILTVVQVVPLVRGGNRAAQGGLPPMSAQHSAAMSIVAVVREHLFGDPPVEQRAAPRPVSTAPLVLAGTLATRNPSRGFALIGSSVTNTKVYPVGGPIADGTTLVEVYTDHVVINRGGQLETLAMPHSSLFASLPPRPRVVGFPDDPEGIIHTEQPPAEEITSRFDKENLHVAAAFVEKPLLSEGQFQGLQVQPGPDPSILKQMGLKPGDVVLGVDGITLDMDHLDLFRKTLASGRKTQISVVRGSEGQVNLDVDSAKFAGLIPD
jgi:type II secretion system protein C